MGSAANPEPEPLILILAPFGRDGALTSLALRGVAPTRVCASVEELARALATSAAGIIAEEALDPATIRTLRATLRKQPSWSDFPFIVLTGQAQTAGENRRAWMRSPSSGT